jgi:hypothetical protein
VSTKADSTVKTLIDRWSGVFARDTVAQYVFDNAGDFAAINAAVAFAKGRGYSCGSIDGINPVAVAGGDCYVGKWHTILKEHHRSLSGVILSNEFRRGPCVFVEYKRGML